jgi:hypothetical protein
MKLGQALRALLATWRGRFILVFLTVQLILPLHYYIVRKDPHDERFAWRMFSPMRAARCSMKAVIDGQPVELTARFHEAWVEIAQRGRMSVIDAMGKRLCELNPGKAVDVTLQCSYLDRPDATYRTNICTRPLL